MAVAAAAGSTLLVASVVVLFEVPPAPFHATLTETGAGVSLDCGKPVTCPAVNLTLVFTTPATLAAQDLVLVVDRNNGSIELWNRSYVASVSLPFNPNSIPHWIADFGGNHYWTGFTATMLNPDRSVVGGPTPDSVGENEIVHSPVTIALSLPAGSIAAGYTVTVTATGHPGSAWTTLY